MSGSPVVTPAWLQEHLDDPTRRGRPDPLRARRGRLLGRPHPRAPAGGTGRTCCGTRPTGSSRLPRRWRSGSGAAGSTRTRRSSCTAVATTTRCTPTGSSTRCSVTRTSACSTAASDAGQLDGRPLTTDRAGDRRRSCIDHRARNGTTRRASIGTTSGRPPSAGPAADRRADAPRSTAASASSPPRGSTTAPSAAGTSRGACTSTDATCSIRDDFTAQTARRARADVPRDRRRAGPGGRGRRVLPALAPGELVWFVMTQVLGWDHVRIYDGSWTEWGSVVGFPVERSARRRGGRRPERSVIARAKGGRRGRGLVAQTSRERLEVPGQLGGQSVPEPGVVLFRSWGSSRAIAAPSTRSSSARSAPSIDSPARACRGPRGRQPADRRLVRLALAVAARNIHSRTRLFSPKPGHRKRPSASAPEPVDVEDPRQRVGRRRPADPEPVGPVVGHVVAAEREHREWVEPQLADLAERRGGRLGAHDRAQEHAVRPVEGLADERERRPPDGRRT